MIFLLYIKENFLLKRRILFSVFISWFVLAIVLVFVDLPLSILLEDSNSFWAEFIALYGEIPGHIIISVSLFLLLNSYSQKTKSYEIILFWIGMIVNSIFMVNILGTFLPEFNTGLGKVFIYSSIMVIGQFILINRYKTIEVIKGSTTQNFAKTSILLAVVNPLLFVQSIKLLWGRTRFRDLSDDNREFTPWFAPQGITGHRSFPSGHTAMGWMVLPLLLLLPKTGVYRRIFQGLIFFWGLFVAIGRIVIGAHYGSDVLFSSGMAFFIYLLLTNDWNKENIQDIDESL